MQLSIRLKGDILLLYCGINEYFFLFYLLSLKQADTEL